MVFNIIKRSLFHYTRVCLQLQSLLIASANRQGGEFPLAVFCCVKKHIRMYKLLNPDVVVIPRKQVEFRCLGGFDISSRRLYPAYEYSLPSTSKLCHSSLLTSKLACHFLMFYIFFYIF